MLEDGQIEPSVSAWSAPTVLVTKKDRSTRFCVDYRHLNARTKKDAFPLPRIDNSLNSLSGQAWFSTLDLASGYWQVRLSENAKPKMAFATHSGLFQFAVMPFGLCNAPATFKRLMSQVMHRLHWKRCLVYIDDILVFSNDSDKYSISDNSRNCSKGQWKYRVKRALRKHHDTTVIQEASAKSKCRGSVQAKTKREEYIDELPKKMACLIFMSRCNMLPIKAHMPFKWTDNPI